MIRGESPTDTFHRVCCVSQRCIVLGNSLLKDASPNSLVLGLGWSGFSSTLEDHLPTCKPVVFTPLPWFLRSSECTRHVINRGRCLEQGILPFLQPIAFTTSLCVGFWKKPVDRSLGRNRSEGQRGAFCSRGTDLRGGSGGKWWKRAPCQCKA